MNNPDPIVPQTIFKKGGEVQSNYPNLLKLVDDAKEQKIKIITTVEAFYKEPSTLYDFLRYAANKGVDVIFAPIVTTDQSAIDKKLGEVAKYS